MQKIKGSESDTPRLPSLESLFYIWINIKCFKSLNTESKRNGRPPTPDDALDYELKEKTKSLNKFDVLIFGEEFCLKAIEKAFQPRLDAATDLQRFVERDPIDLLESKDLTYVTRFFCFPICL